MFAGDSGRGTVGFEYQFLDDLAHKIDDESSEALRPANGTFRYARARALREAHGRLLSACPC